MHGHLARLRGWRAAAAERDFQKPSGGAWEHVGYAHPFVSALDYEPRDPSALYLAAGNGLIRAADHGRFWKILTSYDVTEFRDLAVDRNAPGTISFAHTGGIRVSLDAGGTWQAADCGIRRKYIEAVRVDRAPRGTPRGRRRRRTVL